MTEGENVAPPGHDAKVIPIKEKGPVTFTPFFRWFDLWIGAYIDVENRAIYICPLPMVGVKIRFGWYR